MLVGRNCHGQAVQMGFAWPQRGGSVFLSRQRVSHDVVANLARHAELICAARSHRVRGRPNAGKAEGEGIQVINQDAPVMQFWA